MRRRATTSEESACPALNDEEVSRLTDLAIAVERHYGAPQDTEWAFDADGAVWMLQSRPITAVGSPPGGAADDSAALGSPLVRGIGAAPGLASGAVRVVATLDDARALRAGEVLVTRMTAPDWVPLMRRAAAVVTDSGGMTCHAAIVSRELGMPCIVGTAEATTKLRDGELGHRRRDARRRTRRRCETRPSRRRDPDRRGRTRSSPPGRSCSSTCPSRRRSARVAALDVDGVGLLRAELMIARGARGTTPAPAASRWAAARSSSQRMADGLLDVRRRIRTAARHLPDDRLPHERVPRSGGRRASSSRRRPTR